jgi:hypothetical protein
LGFFKTKDEAMAALGGKGHQEVWSLPITDAMRTKAQTEGFPLFTGGKGGSLAGILSQALTGQPADDSQSSLGDILGRSLTKGR